MYIAFYRWKLKPGKENEFAQLWEMGTIKFQEEHQSLGSRLHIGDDGTHFAYAQWPSKESYHHRKELSPAHKECLKKMGECVLESFPVVLGEVFCDLLSQSK